MLFGASGAVRLEFSTQYTMEEIYELIRNVPFEAGHPQLIRRSSGSLIAWPRIDPYNQVQIIEKRGSFICHCSGHPVGNDRTGPRMLLLRWIAFFKCQRKHCAALARQTGEQINRLPL